MNLNSILNQVLDVAKNSASKLENRQPNNRLSTKVGGGGSIRAVFYQ